jgi:hypothetical protein
VAEVQALRTQHNLSPDDAIECVAAALRRCVNRAASLSPAAQEFWRKNVREA